MCQSHWRQMRGLTSYARTPSQPVLGLKDYGILLFFFRSFCKQKKNPFGPRQVNNTFLLPKPPTWAIADHWQTVTLSFSLAHASSLSQLKVVINVNAKPKIDHWFKESIIRLTPRLNSICFDSPFVYIGLNLPWLICVCLKVVTIIKVCDLEIWKKGEMYQYRSTFLSPAWNNNLANITLSLLQQYRFPN